MNSKYLIFVASLVFFTGTAFFSTNCGSGTNEPATTTTTLTASTTTITTTSTTTTNPPTPGYKIYSGLDPGGQNFSFEYPENWTVSEETLTEDWNYGQWINFCGPGDWQTSVPVLSLWIVPMTGALASETAYLTAVYDDRNVEVAVGEGVGELSDEITEETIAGLTAKGHRIQQRTIKIFGYAGPDGTEETCAMYKSEHATAESEWRAFSKGNYIYDLGFVAIGEKITSREAFLHALNTFRFN